MVIFPELPLVSGEPDAIDMSPLFAPFVAVLMLILPLGLDLSLLVPVSMSILPPSFWSESPPPMVSFGDLFRLFPTLKDTDPATPVPEAPLVSTKLPELPAVVVTAPERISTVPVDPTELLDDDNVTSPVVPVALSTAPLCRLMLPPFAPLVLPG